MAVATWPQQHVLSFASFSSRFWRLDHANLPFCEWTPYVRNHTSLSLSQLVSRATKPLESPPFYPGTLSHKCSICASSPDRLIANFDIPRFRKCCALPPRSDATQVYKRANMVMKLGGLLVLCSFWPPGPSLWVLGSIFNT